MESPLRLVVPLALALGCGGSDDDASSGPIVKIEIRPGGQLLTADRQSARLTATALDADGNQVDTDFTWTSSTPDQVAVDADGTVTAASELGSAAVWAAVGDVRSTPAVIAVVELHPGTLLVTNDQVVETGDGFLPDGAGPEDLPLMDVRLRDVDIPATGSLVVAAESARVGGTVVSAEDAGGGEVAVRLQLVTLPEMIARYDVDWSLPLADYDVRDVDVQPAALLPQEEKLLDKKWPTKGAFQCSANLKAYLETNTVDLKLKGDATFVFKSSRLDESQPPGYLKVALEGPITLVGSLALRAKAGFKGEAKCELKGKFPISLGPFAIVVAPAIPLGVGVSLTADVKVSSMELGFQGENGFDLGVGFECGPGTMPCRSLDKMDPINKFKPLLDVPRGMKDTRLTLEAQAYFLTGIDLIFGLGAYSFEAVEATFGPVQSADLAFVDNQLDDRGHASKYELKIEGKLAPGSGVKKAIKKLLGKENEEDGKLGGELTISSSISKSPFGTMTVDKQTTSPHKTVRFSVNIDPTSTMYFLIGWNVNSILFYRKKVDEPTYELMKELAVSSSGTYTWDWTPGNNDLGKWEFFAMVKTALPVIELEIADDSSRMVEVEGICTGAGVAGFAGLAGGSCELNGTLSYTSANASPTGTITTSTDASVTLQYDEAASTPGLLVFRPYGTWSASHGGSTGGCTVTVSPDPMQGTLTGDPTQGVFMIYTGDETHQPWNYHGDMATGLFPVTTTLLCEGAEPYTTNQDFDFPLWDVLETQNFFVDEVTHRAVGSYTETVTPAPGYSQSKTYTWDLTLTIPDPAPEPPP
jgi:hypothetical protein